ncbi:Crp/Fnr family transcriptional regulator [Dyadobacter chenwenxiniae]|uniref:Crp/Fnr family transcriptional regulator n=1 Tax=Dyadobacter chenwenxiniae TaxID=2906456 RepID=A0A9X1TPJ1_9BACT|nr:Crp/Fnr family transcriptional regulator [Dyadobacter chenwenxiniae]MCF0065578.1 Crp/Fnr family transcriptional regulator [Dyadobacter chenwenxiniae]UON85489.1 Crp/Fnr family transcriptional regulator [Dyadobacter chenwenxiniae]
MEEEYFLSLLEYKNIKRGGLLLEAGRISKVLSFVTKGCLRTFSTQENGIEHILTFAPENWWCSDTLSFNTNAAANYSIDALEDTEMLQITRDKIEVLYEKVPKFERFFRILFQNGFIMQQQRISSELELTAHQKYLKFEQLYPGLEKRIAQNYIASYLGITPVFLSMLRKRK